MVKSVPLIGKQRKPFKALRGVSFEIQTGMFGLLGPNGAGKSTLMRVICGIFEQSYGSIWINGMDTRIYREELQSLIGFLPQEFGTYENMTSWEFLDYQAILKGIIDEDLRKERLEYVFHFHHVRRITEIFQFTLVYYHNLITGTGYIFNDMSRKNDHTIFTQFHQQILSVFVIFLLSNHTKEPKKLRPIWKMLISAY